MKRDKWVQTRKNNGQTNHRAGNAIHAAKPTKRKIVGTEPTLPMIRDLSVTLHENEKRITLSNQRQTHPLTTQKTNYAAPALWGNSRREGVFNRRPNITNADDTTIEFNGTPTEDWLRRLAIASIRKPQPQR